MLGSVLRNSRRFSPMIGATALGTLIAMNSRAFSTVIASSCDSKLDAPLPRAMPLSPVSVILYQYDTCPFCNKVKAYLDYCKVPYTIVEVNPLTKAQLAWLPEYKKVPVAVVNGVLVKDSNVIIDTINAMLMNSSEKTGVGSSGNVRYVDQDDVKLEEWRKFADGPLVQNLTVNIYRTWKEALNTFDYLTQRNFPAWSALPASYVGSTIMWLIAQKRKKQLGIGKPTSDIAQPERESLFGVLNTWTAAINSSGKPFMGGNEPDLNDLAVFGMLRSIHGLSTHADALSLPETREWYTRMEASVGQSSMLHRVGERPLE